MKARGAAAMCRTATTWWRRIFPWRRRAAPPLGHLHVVLYTRQGCHLCEEAWQCLQQEQQRYQFALEAIDVDPDPELAARYGDVVPVVTVNGEVRFRGGINHVLLTRLLRAKSSHCPLR